jgi:hypothetical protein
MAADQLRPLGYMREESSCISLHPKGSKEKSIFLCGPKEKRGVRREVLAIHAIMVAFLFQIGGS